MQSLQLLLIVRFVKISIGIAVLTDCTESSVGFDANHGICYGLVDTKFKSFDDSVAACAAAGGALTLTNSQSKADFMFTAASGIFSGITG